MKLIFIISTLSVISYTHATCPAGTQDTSNLSVNIDGEVAGDMFGKTVSLSSDGTTVAIGAPQNDLSYAYANTGQCDDDNNVAWGNMISTYEECQQAALQLQLPYVTREDNKGMIPGCSVQEGNEGLHWNPIWYGPGYKNDNWNCGQRTCICKETIQNVGRVRIYQDGTQLGNNIDGEAANDLFGSSVSLSSDGTRVAIGAPQNDGANAGHVRIYAFAGNTWTQLGNNIDGEAGDESGSSVSLSEDGNTVAIGAPQAAKGRVRIYTIAGNTWTQLGNNIDGEAANDLFGSSVSLSSDGNGNTVAIGAPQNDGGSVNAAGRVRIYALTEYEVVNTGQCDDDDDVAWGNMISTYEECQRAAKQLQLPYLGRIDTSGMIPGCTVKEGNEGLHWNPIWYGSGHSSFNGYTNDNWNCGQRTCICKKEVLVWTKRGNNIDGQVANDLFGSSVSLSEDGNTVAIGAPQNDATGANAGHVRIYAFADNLWTKIGWSIYGEAGDESGSSVSLSSDGNTVAIGAPKNDGTVRIYAFADASQSKWTQIGNIIDGEAGDEYGSSVSLSSDGNTVAIGAPKNDGTVRITNMCTECGDGLYSLADGTNCVEHCPTGTYADTNTKLCTACSPVENGLAPNVVTCNSADTSHLTGECESSAFWKDTTGTADVCTECTVIHDAAASDVTYNCTSNSDTRFATGGCDIDFVKVEGEHNNDVCEPGLYIGDTSFLESELRVLKTILTGFASSEDDQKKCLSIQYRALGGC